MVKDRKLILVEGTFISNCIRIVIFAIVAKVSINIIISIILEWGFKTLSKLDGVNLCSDRKLNKSDIKRKGAEGTKKCGKNIKGKQNSKSTKVLPGYFKIPKLFII